MTKEDILRMAREAGAASDRDWSASACDVREIFKLWPEELEQFAAAIRSATKEEDARICDELWNRGAAIAEYCNKGNDNDWWLDAEAWMKIAAENGTSECADAIRASK